MKKVLKAIPEVFALHGSDYGKFVVRGGASQMMRDAWQGVGIHMGEAIAKVGAQAQQQKKAGRRVSAKEAA